MGKDTVMIESLDGKLTEYDLYPVEYVETLKKQVEYFQGYVWVCDDTHEGKDYYHEELLVDGKEDLIEASTVNLETFLQ